MMQKSTGLTRGLNNKMITMNKHLKEVHMGTPFKYRLCPKKYKTRSNKKKHEDKSCTSRHPPAGAAHRTYTPAPEPNFLQSGPQSPEPGNGEDSVKDRSVSGHEEEALPSCSTGNTDREARRSHAPQSPSPTEFVTAILQEPFEQGREYTSPREGPDSKEARRGENPDLIGRPGEET